ncbi:MAG: hypothetical protein V1709_00910 [Planctomycetota bacterium]
MKCLCCNTETVYLGRANCNQSDMFRCPGCSLRIECIHAGVVAIDEESIGERDGELTGRCLFCGEVVTIQEKTKKEAKRW